MGDAVKGYKHDRGSLTPDLWGQRHGSLQMTMTQAHNAVELQEDNFPAEEDGPASKQIRGGGFTSLPISQSIGTERTVAFLLTVVLRGSVSLGPMGIKLISKPGSICAIDPVCLGTTIGLPWQFYMLF